MSRVQSRRKRDRTDRIELWETPTATPSSWRRVDGVGTRRDNLIFALAATPNFGLILIPHVDDDRVGVLEGFMVFNSVQVRRLGRGQLRLTLPQPIAHQLLRFSYSESFERLLLLQAVRDLEIDGAEELRVPLA